MYINRNNYVDKPKDPLVWLNYVLTPKYTLDPTNYICMDIPIGSQHFSPSETPKGRLQHFLFLTSFLIG
jgi:hypothetical protein